MVFSIKCPSTARFAQSSITSSTYFVLFKPNEFREINYFFIIHFGKMNSSLYLFNLSSESSCLANS
jgi:hypothetical protein